jgi:hypothetical protein
VVAGLLLFSVRAREYAEVGFLQATLVLVAVGKLAALALHRRRGFLLETAGNGRLAGHAVIPLHCWPAALGRVRQSGGNSGWA